MNKHPNNSWLEHFKGILLLPFTVTIVIPFLLMRYASRWQLLPDHWLVEVAGALLLVAGLYLLILTIHYFRTKGQGTLAPWNPPRQLVVAGPYRYVRNPMISGVLGILLGEGLLLGVGAILCWAALFFCINTLYFLLSEEPGLRKRFGSSYEHYCQNVPRWIPNRKPYQAIKISEDL